MTGGEAPTAEAHIRAMAAMLLSQLEEHWQREAERVRQLPPSAPYRYQAPAELRRAIIAAQRSTWLHGRGVREDAMEAAQRPPGTLKAFPPPPPPEAFPRDEVTPSRPVRDEDVTRSMRLPRR